MSVGSPPRDSVRQSAKRPLNRGRLLERVCRVIGNNSAIRSYLLSADEFGTLLIRERMRTDRSGLPFALLVFVPIRSGRERHAELAAVLQQRLRFSDQCGHFDEGQIGALLPETSAEGAWRVVEDILSLLPEGCEVDYEVFVYPGDVKDDDGGTNDRPDEPNELLAPASSRTWYRSDPLPTGSVSALFVRPLPRWKRAIDLFGAIFGLTLFLPVMLAAALAIKLSSPGPIFFKQRRHGLGGRPFTIYKFRTMHVGADEQKAALRAKSEQDGPAFKLTHDPRVFRVGSLLRKTSIDELPQFLNVLLGDMSLVGPRPLPCDEQEACRLWQQRRLEATPGLTCIWQVRGRSRVTFDEWIRMDLEYIRRRNIWRDAALLILTIPAVLLRRGAK